MQQETEKSGLMPWSPELKKSGETLLYWRYRIQEHTSRKCNQIMLDRLATSCNISEIDRGWLSVANICNKIRDAKSKHKKVKLDAAELRKTHLNEQAVLLAALQRMSKVAARAAIAARKKAANQFRTLRWIFKQGQSNGLERLDVPNELRYYAAMRRNRGFSSSQRR
jgi:hypothetical protein